MLASPYTEIDDPKSLQGMRRGVWVVRFVMKGCPYCQESQGDWESACSRVKLNPGAHMAQVDSDLADRFTETFESDEIPGFPHTVVVREGKVLPAPIEGRDVDSILAAAMQHNLGTVNDDGPVNKASSKKASSKKASSKKASSKKASASKKKATLPKKRKRKNKSRRRKTGLK